MPIEFSPSSRPDSRRAFTEHLARFERQGRDIDWQSAPEVFAGTYGKADKSTLHALRGAMESLFDKGELKVERQPNGSNKLVAVAKSTKSSRRTRSCAPT